MSLGTVIVTGASRGIGAATAIGAARRGYDVLVNFAGNRGAAQTVVGAVEEAGAKAVAVQADVSRPEDVKRIFEAADAMAPLVGLVNNAGIVAPAMRVDEMDVERIERILAVNVTGTMLCAIEAVKRMSTRHGGKGGAIVNLSSAAAKLGAPSTYVDYAAAKGAIDSFTVGLALEVAGEGIRVNAVRPGIIATDIHAAGGDPDRAHRIASSLPIPRAGTAEEVANAILWLLSEEASYSTGTILAVTGGRAIAP
ncbi:SDR family oxidoreductase [Arsenicitalea aurantiaca]|uniref:SDR family oxidoreductase n=1 Tax=Arsenicitalea aurantiaca TaxID=1783274 RepID=A0A433X5I1_9HYPH|nr:SDR family oxidoreductase [Arsenicitalea aurantiaca]RUT29307.1 SDR family oxidoreductase [Arsenicitalea aurantiaca]